MNKDGYKESLFTSAAQMEGADNYNEWTFDLFRQFIRGDVLEVGCGVGSFTGRIIRQSSFDSLLSIDISHDAVDYCRDNFIHTSLKFECVDIQLVNGKFDAVICMNVLEHIEDHENALRHMFDLLKPDGKLFLLVPAHQFLYNRFDLEGGHFRRYDKQAVRELLSRAAGDRLYVLEQFYFNIVGALGYWFVYKVLNKIPQQGAKSEIGFFDKLVVPVMSKLEGRFMPFGISLISIVTKR